MAKQIQPNDKTTVDPAALAAAAPPASTAGMTETTIRELAKAMQKPEQPIPLISKGAREPMRAFYVRAETSGIGRRCLKCGATRRYTLIACPNCHEQMFEDCKVSLVEEAVALEHADLAIQVGTHPGTIITNPLL